MARRTSHGPAAFACGPDFPQSLLDDRKASLLNLPEGTFLFEAGRLLPGMPATVARKVQQATHHAFVGAFNDTARFTALLLAGTLVIAVAIARRPQRTPAHVPDPPPVVGLEQPVSVG